MLNVFCENLWENLKNPILQITIMVIISVQAYCKMILHAAKYPHNTVNGILLATARKDTPSDRKEVVVCDAVPLFHISIHLTPMSEVALLQVRFLIKLLSITLKNSISCLTIVSLAYF